ncbi:MAG: MarR family winged helix-turn-helix transcriptional regulator [Nostocoides sp.]
MTTQPSHSGPTRERQVLLVLRAAALVQSQLEDALHPYDLTSDRWRALKAVQAHPGASMAELIDALVMPSTSATRTVDALVEMGALFRAPDPDDRRRVTLHLSAQGKRLLRQVQDGVAGIILPDEAFAPR